MECELFCVDCNEVISRVNLACQAAEGRGERSYTINKQAVFASLVCSLGATAFNNLCEALNLQGLHPSTFHKKSK